MIGVFDSGSGGMSVLKEILRLLPEEKYIYFADNAFCPYGEKSPQVIIDRCREISKLLIDKGCEIIVIACNTATAAAVSTLRKEFPISFIGMEPAIKPAALGTKSGVIGVLATAGTLKGSKYLNTKGLYDENVRIEENVGKGFVELVEEGKQSEEIVKASLQPLLDKGADTIVLGCTHYPFLLETMKKVAPPQVRFIDPAPSVAKQLVKIMSDTALLSKEEAARALERKDAGLPRKPSVTLLSSGSDEALKRTYNLIFDKM